NARRWRSLLSEAQVVLHNHPWNARRAERGLAPVNSLWFWGGGALPDQVTTTSVAVRSDEALLRALATRAGVPVSPVGRGFDTPAAGDVLVDLRGMPDMAALASAWLSPALAALHAGQLGSLRLDFADGAGVVLERRQRWRFWRRPLAGLSRLPPLQP